MPEGPPNDDDDIALARLRVECLRFPEVSEAGSWGHPNFRAGKRTFAAYEWINGRPSIAIKLGADEVDAMLLSSNAAFNPPYGAGQWVSFWADGLLDWTRLAELLERSYRKVAIRRMLAALDAPE